MAFESVKIMSDIGGQDRNDENSHAGKAVKEALEESGFDELIAIMMAC